MTVIRSIIILFCSVLTCFIGVAQQVYPEHSLEGIKKEAFEGDKQKAIQLCYPVLKHDPEYHDVRLLLANLYAWTKQYDSARYHLNFILSKKPEYIDANISASNVELWSGNYITTIEKVNKGLEQNPDNSDLLLIKAKALEQQLNYNAAIGIVENLYEKNQNDISLKQYLIYLQGKQNSKYVGLQHSYEYFEKPYSRSAHITSLELNLSTKIGKVIPRINTGFISEFYNSFEDVDWQLECDFYPIITAKDYLYINYGYAFKTFFPEHRAGLEWFHTLPKQFEASVGGRMLYFEETVLIYTGSLSKYWKSYWFSIRPYFIPNSEGIAQVYSATARWYYSGVDDYLSCMFISGYSPDEYTDISGIAQKSLLSKYKFELMYQNRINKLLLKGGISYELEEYQDNITRNVLGVKAGIHYYF